MRRIARAEGPSSGVIRQLRDYWLRLRGDRRMPARRDVDPIHIPRLLPHLALTEVFHEPLRMRYRLVGSYITEMAGRNATGRWLDAELYGARTEDMLWAFHTCIAERSPVLVREEVQFATKKWLNVEAMLLPLGDDAARVDLVLSAVDVAAAGAEAPPDDTSFILDWRAATPASG